MNQRFIVGIDEVGRGPIAGPVAVGAFKCKKGFFDTLGIKTPLRDSKKLSKKQRGEWFEYLKSEKEHGNCDFAVTMVSAEWIDKVGIVRAIQKALDASLSKLDSNRQLLDAALYLDGGLKAPNEYKNQETIIKGDELHPVISCASIVAKVMRDKVMAGYGKEYPNYGFENHCGYGTKAHYLAIKKHGIIVLHRRSFL